METKSPAKIRLAETSDVAALEALLRTSTQHVEVGAELEREISLFVVVEGEAGSILGFALGWVVADELEILDVLVSETSRRQGLALALVDELIERGKTRGAERALLEVRASNAAAIALYRKRGFEEDGRRRGYYPSGEDALLFSRFLREKE